MKMFKKIMAVALTAAMAVSMLTGCAFTDKLKNDHVRDAIGDVASTYVKKDDSNKVETVQFESKSSLNTELKKLLKDAKAEDIATKYEGGAVVDGKYIVTAVEIEKSTSSVSEFKNYALELLAGLYQEDNGKTVNVKADLSTDGKTATVKAGVKVDGFKNTKTNKTVYYAVVLVEVATAA